MRKTFRQSRRSLPTCRDLFANYAAQKEVANNPKVDPALIMNSLTSKTVPVISALAHNYAVFDHWFASLPTQTFCNRSFVHAGTSSGYVNNAGSGRFFVNDTTTIFDLLDDVENLKRKFNLSMVP